jgi:hypothetical protein
MDWDSLKTNLEKHVPQNKVFFNVATLEYLQKGGRIGLGCFDSRYSVKTEPDHFLQ